MERPLRALWVASECSPFARVGALGDVVAEVTTALRQRGVDARVVLPRYRWVSPVAVDGMSRHLAPLAVPLGEAEAWCAVYDATIPGTDVPAYFLDHEVLFDRPYLYDPPHGTAHDNLARFAFLSRGALQLARHLGWVPDIVHAHDWPSALACTYVDAVERRGMLARVASVLTVHDLSQQGRFSSEEFRVTGLGDDARRDADDHGAVNLLRAALRHAHAVTAASRRLADAMVTPEGGVGLDDLARTRELTALSDDEPCDASTAAARLVDVYRNALDARRARV